jgi:hypothetical protein
MPSASASCMAIEVRVPPMSVEPSTRLTVPSALTLAVTVDLSPILNQKPLATPRPRFALADEGRAAAGLKDLAPFFVGAGPSGAA